MNVGKTFGDHWLALYRPKRKRKFFLLWNIKEDISRKSYRFVTTMLICSNTHYTTHSTQNRQNCKNTLYRFKKELPLNSNLHSKQLVLLTHLRYNLDITWATPTCYDLSLLKTISFLFLWLYLIGWGWKKKPRLIYRHLLSHTSVQLYINASCCHVAWQP